MSFPIVILHGWGTSSRAWQIPKKLLEERGFQVFIPDLPGFGDEPPPSFPWSVDDYANFVINFAQKNKISKFLLIGHSFGGRLGIYLAANYKQNLFGVVLTGVPIGQRKSLKNLFFLCLSKTGKILFSVPPLSFLTPFFRKFIYILVGEWDYYKTKGVMRQTFKKVINEDLRPLLCKISLPVLILWGEIDKITPVSFAYLLQEKIPSARLKIVAGATHKLPYEQPEVFTREVLEFIKTI